MFKIFMLCVSLFLFAESAAAGSPNIVDPPFRQRGDILVELKGRGVYTYDGDKAPNQSDCLGQCRLLWPPMYAEDEAKPKGAFTIFVRKDDGKRQWAFKGRPLYRWVSDLKRGDAGGDGVAGVWRLIKVVAKPVVVPTTENPAEKPGQKTKQN